MNYSVFSYKWNSRDLKKIITILLKSWNAEQIKKFNYIHNYSIEKWKIEKTEEQMILIYSKNQNSLIKFLSENFPQIKKIEIN